MNIIEINEEEFNEKVLTSSKKVLVDFYAIWCGPCKMMENSFEELEINEEEYNIYKMNIDKCPNISRKYGVMSIPNLIIFNNGEIEKNEVGFKSTDELKEFLDV